MTTYHMTIDPIMIHMYHICIIYVSYMTHVYHYMDGLQMEGKEEMRGKGKRIGCLASLPNCYIKPGKSKRSQSWNGVYT